MSWTSRNRSNWRAPSKKGARAPESCAGAPSALLDERRERHAIGLDQASDPVAVHVRDDDLAHLVVDGAEEPPGLHPLGLPVVVLGRRQVVDGLDAVAVHQVELKERHQALATEPPV